MSRPFAYNTGLPISGTTQVGNLAIGNHDTLRYDLNYGGLVWWMGPPESEGYIIAEPLNAKTEPTPIDGVTEWFSFSQSNGFSDSAFLSMFNSLQSRIGLSPLTSINDAYLWLNNNGHWTSYQPATSTPTPTPTNTSTPTPTPTNTSTPTPTPSNNIETFYILFEDGSIMTDDNNNQISKDN
jgi:hypothetical protein